MLINIFFAVKLLIKPEILKISMCLALKVGKMAKIRNRYNQVTHLTQDTTWVRNKNAINITNKSQEVSPFPAGDHKAANHKTQKT